MYHGWAVLAFLIPVVAIASASILCFQGFMTGSNVVTITIYAFIYSVCIFSDQLYADRFHDQELTSRTLVHEHRIIIDNEEVANQS